MQIAIWKPTYRAFLKKEMEKDIMYSVCNVFNTHAHEHTNTSSLHMHMNTQTQADYKCVQLYTHTDII